MPKPVYITPAQIKAAQALLAKAAKQAPAPKAKAPKAKAEKPKAPAKRKPSKAKLPPKAERVAMLESAIETAKASPARKVSAPLFSDYASHWSPFQTAIFDFVRGGKGSALVEAVAGSGKTTTICEGIRYMRGSVVALAFNRSIANELKERLAPFPNVKAGTVHSIGLSALRKNLPHFVKVDGDKMKWIFQDLLQTETNFIVKGNVCKLAGLAKDAGAGIDFRIDDVEAWQKLAEHFSIPTEQSNKSGTETFDLIALAQKLLDFSNKEIKAIKGGKTMLRVDFSDMIYLPILWNLPLEKFDWVIVDEAQDLNLTRRLFIKALSGPATRHLIVGDTFQAIYGFTGADARSMENMRTTFDCQTFPLSVCYRCASAVIEHAQTWMPNIEAAPNAPLGEVSDLDYGKAMENPAETFRPSDAILCRNNAPIVKTAMQFIRANIPCKVEGNDLTGRLVALANDHKAGSLLATRSAVIEAGEEKVSEAQAKGHNGKAAQISDLTETLLVFIDRALELGNTFEEMLSMIKGFFSTERENGEAREVVTLSTIHKAKGREWSRVFWLGRDQFQPSKFAKLEWELDQEKNLCYVAATRAKVELVELVNFPASGSSPEGTND